MDWAQLALQAYGVYGGTQVAKAQEKAAKAGQNAAQKEAQANMKKEPINWAPWLIGGGAVALILIVVMASR